MSGDREAEAIVCRIWAIYGNPSYEELAGCSIYDLIEADRARLDATEEALREVRAILDSWVLSGDDVAGIVSRAENVIDAVLAVPATEAQEGRPRPDFDPHIDYPERYTEGPV